MSLRRLELQKNIGLYLLPLSQIVIQSDDISKAVANAVTHLA